MVKKIVAAIKQFESFEDSSIDFFIVLHDHRKAQLARYKRKLRKDKRKELEIKVNEEKNRERTERN